MASLARFSTCETMDRRTNRRDMLIQSLSGIKNVFPQLSSVKSCVMLGCGRGHLDLEFVSRYLPNVKKLTAVDPDLDQIAAFEARVAQLLPNVITEFCQETAQSWKAADQPFDAVLLFHCLCYIPQFERPVLLKKLFDNVLSSGGLVFILTSPCNRQNPTTMCRLFDLLSIPSYGLIDFVDGVQVCDMMTSVGFGCCYQLPIEYQVDVEEPNDMMAVFAFLSRGRLSLEKVRETAQEMIGSEKAIQHEMWFGVFEKP